MEDQAKGEEEAEEEREDVKLVLGTMYKLHGSEEQLIMQVDIQGKAIKLEMGMGSVRTVREKISITFN